MEENQLVTTSPNDQRDTKQPDEHAPVLRVWLFEGGRLTWHVPPSYEQEPWTGRRAARAVFFLLLCAPNRQALRGQLTGILWPETEEENARSCLRSALKVLRQVLRLPQGDPLIEATQNGDALQLKGQEIIWTDTDAFELLVQQAGQEPDPQQAFLLWQHARTLLKGDILAEDRLQEWVNQRWIKVRRQRVQAARRRLVRSLADLYVQRGENTQAEALLQEHIISFPTDQDALYRFMKLLINAECFEEARAAYEQGKAALLSRGKPVAEPLKALAEHLTILPQTLLPAVSLVSERAGGKGPPLKSSDEGTPPETSPTVYSPNESRLPLFRVWLCGPFGGERRVGEESYQSLSASDWGGTTYSRLLLKALLCSPGRHARRDALLERVWSELDMKQASQCLNSATTKLREVLRPGKEEASLLISESNSSVYRLPKQDVLWTDVDAALVLLTEAERVGRLTPPALHLLEEAAEYFNRGAFLEDEEGLWLSSYRASIERARVRARLWLSEAYVQQGRLGQAETVLNVLLEEDPTDEEVVCRLMVLLAQQGMTHQALRLYKQTCETFANEGLEPTKVMKRLSERIQERSSWEHLFIHPQTLSEEGEAQIGTTRKNESVPFLPSPPVSQDETHSHFSQVIKQGIIEAIHELEETTNLDISRRHLLSQILPFFFGISDTLFDASVKETASVADEVLSFYMTAIPAYWSLIYNGGIKYVERVLPSYLAHLITFLQQSPQRRLIAANLTSQGFQIAAMISLENENYDAALSQINSAIAYAQIVQDVNLETAALMRKVTVLWYWRRFRQMHEVLQVASENVESVSPLMQASIYSALAADVIASDSQQRIFSNIKKARDICPQKVELDPVFSFTYITPYLIHFNENIACMNLNRAKDAWNALEMAEQYVSPLPSSRRMELLTHQISVATALGNLDRSYEKTKEAIEMNHVLVSNLWSSTLENIYEVLQNKWGTDIKIKRLRELIRHN